MRFIEKNICLNYPERSKNSNFQPMLYGYLQDASSEMSHSECRAAVIVCPGGSYRYRADREGEPVAMRFLSAGMQAFVLHYSVAPDRYPAAFLELAASVAEIRTHAGEWNIDPDRIFVCGFSAGGHLCAGMGTDWKNPLLGQYLSVENYLWKPDGMILCYPVISLEEYTHEESCQNLTGSREDLPALLSWQKRVTADTVPAFIWATFEDELVPVENSLLFAAALQKERVPYELHLYEKGAHALALCDETTAEDPSQIQPDAAGWTELAVHWIRRRQDRKPAMGRRI